MKALSGPGLHHGRTLAKRNFEGQLRYLLARRLTREGQFEMALDDYPNPIKPIHQERIQAIRSGRDPSLSLSCALRPSGKQPA